jgi:hypothetical protein
MVRFLGIASLVCAFVFAFCVAGADAQEKGKKGKFGKFDPKEAFKKADENADGKVSKAEYEKSLKARDAKAKEFLKDKYDAEKASARMQQQLKAFDAAVGDAVGLDEEGYGKLLRASFGGKKKKDA